MEQQSGVFGGLSAAYLREANSHPQLTKEQETELAKRIARGDRQARQQMIVCNLRLVMTIAREYANYGMDVTDLIEEGNLGLMKAVERFNPKKNAKLSTYAGWWIRCYIRRALNSQSRCVRMTSSGSSKLRKLSKCREQLSKKLGRAPTVRELSERLAWSEYDVEHITMCGRSPQHLDERQYDDSGSESLRDAMVDENAVTPDKVLDSVMARSELYSLMNLLDQRDAQLIALRFGINGGEPMTLADVGRRFGLTRERVRQLQEKSFEQLRNLMAVSPQKRVLLRPAPRTHTNLRKKAPPQPVQGQRKSPLRRRANLASALTP